LQAEVTAHTAELAVMDAAIATATTALTNATATKDAAIADKTTAETAAATALSNFNTVTGT